MGVQLHRFDWIRKSKRRTQFDHVSLQHQTQHQYPRRTRFNSQTQDMELTLQERELIFIQNDLFKAFFSLNIDENKSMSIKN